MPEADPELVRRLSVEVQRIYSEATAEMLERVARRLAVGIDSPGWAEAKLADVGRLRAEITRVIAGLDAAAPNAVSGALGEAFEDGARAALPEVAELQPARPYPFGRNSGRALRQLVSETVTQVTSTHGGILRSTLDRYRAIVAEATTRMTIGTETRREATARALGAFAREGIRGFVDSAGRRWEIDSYAEMATRTASGRARIAGSLERLEERGIDLVIVSNAPEECKICRPWEGKVLSISGGSVGSFDGVEVAGTVSQAQAAGLQHGNCRHNLTAFIPGLTRVPTHTADPEGDKLRQRQRALERQVRQAKRNVAAQSAFVDQLKAEPGGVDPEALAKLSQARLTQRAATARLTEFVEANDRKRLRYREKI